MGEAELQTVEDREFHGAVSRALDKAARRTLWEHKRLGYPIVVADENGKPVWIPAEEIPVPDTLDE